MSSAVLQVDRGDRVSWLRAIPFAALHATPLAVFVVGVSATAVAVAIAFLFLRVFAVTAFFHRYFSHRTFKTGRVVQFLGAALATTAAQRGPLWWAAHHRAHHRDSDSPDDAHSPRQHGFLWSHTLWFLTPNNFRTDPRLVRDWRRFRELCWLDRFDFIPPVVAATAMFVLGETLALFAPALGTNGWQMLVWGFFVSTICLYHITYAVNSVAHRVGTRRFKTKDDSRNNWLLALITFGEGWHNNHHRYPVSVRQGFYWWEIDVTFYVLLALSKLSLIWDLKSVPHGVLDEGRRSSRATATDQETSMPQAGGAT
jgi:stearoyl-CoA desaturase (delta-9 desaturase)